MLLKRLSFVLILCTLVSQLNYSERMEPHLRAIGRHLAYGITQCYLPPDTSECAVPHLTPVMQAGTRFMFPGGMEG